MQCQRHCTHSKEEEEEVCREEEEDEELIRDMGTIEGKDVPQKFGVIGALLQYILQPTAGARRYPHPHAHEKTQWMAATIVEKKDISDLIVRQGEKDIPYTTEGILSRKEKTIRRRKLAIYNDS